MIDEKDSPFLKKMECRHCHGNGKAKFGRTCRHCRGTGFWLKSEDENVYKVCEECHGTGFDRINSKCKKCDGIGYFNWLDEVFPKPKVKTYPEIYTFSTYNMTFDSGFKNSVLNQLSQKPSNQTDNKIVKQISSSCISLTNNSCISYTFSLPSLRTLNGVLNDRNI